MSLKEELAEYRAGWFKRVPAERQAIMERHIAQLRDGLAKTALKVGDRAPSIVLGNAKGETVDVGALLKKGPVIVAFYRGGWCPLLQPRTAGVPAHPSRNQGGGCVAGRDQP